MNNTYVLQKAFDETAKYVAFIHESKMQARKEMQSSADNKEAFNDGLKKYSLFDTLECSAKENLKEIIKRLLRENATIIVTKKEQLVALAIFFAEEGKISLNDYKIVNLKEKYLASFPANDEFCKSFYKAYCIGSWDEIMSLYNKNLT